MIVNDLSPRSMLHTEARCNIDEDRHKSGDIFLKSNKFSYNVFRFSDFSLQNSCSRSVVGSKMFEINLNWCTVLLEIDSLVDCLNFLLC